MKLFDIFGKKDSNADINNGVPYSIKTELIPYKMHARKKSSSVLRVSVSNVTKDVLMTSLVLELPKGLSFDEMSMGRQREIRIGEMQPNENKEVSFEIFTGIGSEAGDYTATLTSIAHYRDYGHVLNAVRKRVELSVV